MIINMPVKSVGEKALPLVLPLDGIERTREALIQLEVAAQLAQLVLDKAAEYGQEATMRGVREIFQAAASLMA